MTTELAQSATRAKELALLLLCARTQVDDAAAGRIRELIDTGINWQAFYELAKQHWVTILCHRALQRVDPARVPAEIMAGLRASVQQLTWHGLLLLANCAN